MHGYGRVTTKRQRDRKSVGGRNGDQYATTVGRGGEQTEVEKRGGVTEGEKEQKMDTV